MTDPFAQAKKFERQGMLLVALGAPSLLVSIFSVPFGIYVLASQPKVGLFELGVVGLSCGTPVLATLVLLGFGVPRLMRAARVREQASSARIERAHAMPAVPPRRLDANRYKSVSRWLLIRGLFYTFAAIPCAVFAMVWIFLTLVGFFTAVDDAYSVVALLLVLLLGGVIPTLVTLLLTWRGYANLRDYVRLRQLRAALESAEVTTFDELGKALGVSTPKAETAVSFAVGRGLLAPETVASLRSGVVSVAPRPADALESFVGRTLNGRYRIEAPLGHGGMGAVFRALVIGTEVRVALKVLLPKSYESPEALTRFEHEASALRAIGHPGIVRVHAFERAEDGTPYLVMDLLEGETLEQRLARLGALDWAHAKQIALAAGEALAAAHDAGLLHRDLKPANIFLARTPHAERPMLVDFGLAKRVGAESGSRLTTSGVVVGTPLYMSPEQARGELLDARSDVFGLGVVVYEMVTGVPPFFDKTLAEVYARLLHEAAPLASSRSACPPELDRALAMALANRREDRFKDVRSFMSALASVPVSSDLRQIG